MIEQVDILIIGGGLTGATLMLALADKGYSCLLVDTHSLTNKITSNFDARSLALSPASVRILQMLKLWSLIEPDASAIKTIHVSEQGRFGGARLTSSQDKSLGYVVETQHINRALFALLDKDKIVAPAQLSALSKTEGIATIKTQTGERVIKAELIVAADGSDSMVRKLSKIPIKAKTYAQHAIVANIGLKRDHLGNAYERFTASGPLALLPMTQSRAALVWAMNPTLAKQLQQASGKQFLAELQKAVGYRLGRFQQVGKRAIFPLQHLTMPKKTAWPLVFVGNAAQTLHPVAGQGFNLGLRDVAALAQCIIQFGLDEQMLEHYQMMRQHDTNAISYLTRGLVELFTSRLPGLPFTRSIGLIAIDNFAFLQRCLVHYASGYAGVTPDLVCGIALNTKEGHESAF